MRKLFPGSLLLLWSLVLLPATQARASCVCAEVGPMEVLPGDGAQGVPLDARIWVFAAFCGDLVKVVLNGEELTDIQELGQGSSVFSLDPGELEASTSYQFTLVFSGEGFDGEQSFGPYQFTTGVATAESPEMPQLSNLEGQGVPDLYEPLTEEGHCLDLLRQRDCFDLGDNGLFTAQDDAGQPALYMVQRVQPGAALQDDSKATPVLGSCGPGLIAAVDGEQFLTGITVDQDFCLQVRAYNLAGAAAEASVICGQPVPSDGDDDNGCALGGGSGGATPALLLLLAALLLLRRRVRGV